MKLRIHRFAALSISLLAGFCQPYLYATTDIAPDVHLPMYLLGALDRDASIYLCDVDSYVLSAKNSGPSLKQGQATLRVTKTIRGTPRQKLLVPFSYGYDMDMSLSLADTGPDWQRALGALDSHKVGIHFVCIVNPNFKDYVSADDKLPQDKDHYFYMVADSEGNAPDAQELHELQPSLGSPQLDRMDATRAIRGTLLPLTKLVLSDIDEICLMHDTKDTSALSNRLKEAVLSPNHVIRLFALGSTFENLAPTDPDGALKILKGWADASSQKPELLDAQLIFNFIRDEITVANYATGDSAGWKHVTDFQFRFLVAIAQANIETSGKDSIQKTVALREECIILLGMLLSANPTLGHSITANERFALDRSIGQLPVVAGDLSWAEGVLREGLNIKRGI